MKYIYIIILCLLPIASPSQSSNIWFDDYQILESVLNTKLPNIKVELIKPLQAPVKIIDGKVTQEKTFFRGRVIELKYPKRIKNDTTSITELFNYAEIREHDKPIRLDAIIGAVSLNDGVIIKEWLNNYYQNVLTDQTRKDSIDRLTHSDTWVRENRMAATLKAFSYHNFLSIFTAPNMDFNFSHLRLLDFLRHYMRMSESSNNYANGYITSIITESVSSGTPQKMTIKYKVTEGYDNNWQIQNVTITGSFQSVAELFITYWATKLQTTDLRRNEWAFCYMLPDKIGFFCDKAGNAKIYIENTLK